MHVTFVIHDSQIIISNPRKKTIHVTFVIHYFAERHFNTEKKKNLSCVVRHL